MIRAEGLGRVRSRADRNEEAERIDVAPADGDDGQELGANGTGRTIMSVFSMMRFGFDERPARIPFTRSSRPGGHVETAAVPIDRRFLDHM